MIESGPPISCVESSVPSGTICAWLVPHLEQVDVLDRLAIFAVRLDGDLPVAAEVVVAVDVERPQVHVERLVHVVERHAQGGDLGPIDVEVELRRVGAELGGHVVEAGLAPSACGPALRSVSARSARPRPPRSSTMSLKPPAVPRPGIGDVPNTVTWASLTFGESAHALRQRRHDGRVAQLGILPLVERVQDDEHRREVGAVGLEQERHARHADRVRHALASRCGRSDRPPSAPPWSVPATHESGIWTLTMRRPWSCCGMKPVGAF